MIKIHKWECKDCDTRLFLRVDDQDEEKKARLEKFGNFVTKHCISLGHEVIHKEKTETGAKFV